MSAWVESAKDGGPKDVFSSDPLRPVLFRALQRSSDAPPPACLRLPLGELSQFHCTVGYSHDFGNHTDPHTTLATPVKHVTWGNHPEAQLSL